MPALAPAARPPALAPGGTGPLLSLDDLHDPELFEIVKRVPILDAHDDDPEHGPVDEALLKRLAQHSNAAVQRGDFPKISLGHTLRKQTIIVVKDGKKHVHEGADEATQPPVVGYLTGFHVAPYQGKPTLHADFHLHRHDASYARTYPFRSVERLSRVDEHDRPDPSADAIDYVALLRTPPRRNLGVMRYERDEAAPAIDAATAPAGTDGATTPAPARYARYCYARDLPPLAEDGPERLAPPATDPEPAPTAAEAPEPQPESADMATAAAPAPDANAPAAAPMTLGEMNPEEFLDLIIQGFRAALHEEASAHVAETEGAEPGAETDQYADYEAPEEMPEGDEETSMNIDPYEAAEPGAGNVFTPGGTEAPEDSRRRMQYERQVQDMGRRLKENEEILDILVTRLTDADHRERRMQYERRLNKVKADGYVVDVDALLADLAPDAPADYEDRKEREIRSCYARSPVGRRTLVDVAASEGPGAPKGIASKEQANAVIDYATKHRCSIPEAKKALNLI